MRNRATLDNTGRTLDLSGISGGLFQVNSGAIRGGVVEGVEHLQFTRSDNNLLDGVTLGAGDLDLTNGGWTHIRNGLVLEGTMRLGNDALLFFENTQSLSGGGEVVFADPGRDTRLSIEGDSVLTIEPGMTLRGVRGFIGSHASVLGTDTLINRGRIEADQSGQPLTIRSDVFINEGRWRPATGDAGCGYELDEPGWED